MLNDRMFLRPTSINEQILQTTPWQKTTIGKRSFFQPIVLHLRLLGWATKKVTGLSKLCMDLAFSAVRRFLFDFDRYFLLNITKFPAELFCLWSFLLV